MSHLVVSVSMAQGEERRELRKRASKCRRSIVRKQARKCLRVLAALAGRLESQYGRSVEGATGPACVMQDAADAVVSHRHRVTMSEQVIDARSWRDVLAKIKRWKATT